VADDGNRRWGNDVWWCLNRNGSVCWVSLIWRGNCLSGFLSLLRLVTGFLYYAMSTLQVCSLCVFTKGVRGWAYKNKKKGNKGKWRQREWEEWVYAVHTCRAEFIESGGSVVCNILHTGIFSWMPIWSRSCRSARLSLFSLRESHSVCSSLSYLPAHQHSLLDLSPFRYLLLTAETVPADGNSMA
jgi:hypothetical protein